MPGIYAAAGITEESKGITALRLPDFGLRGRAITQPRGKLVLDTSRPNRKYLPAG